MTVANVQHTRSYSQWPKLFIRSQWVGSRESGECRKGGGERRIPLRLSTRPILADAKRDRSSYVANTIRTSRYTLWDFLPKQFFFQFTRLGNFYFLCVGIPQTVPGLSTTGNFTTILPLMFFVLLTIAKEGYDDYKRHCQDTIENANPTTVLSICNEGKRDAPTGQDNAPSSEWVDVCWKDIHVGDIVKLKRDDPVPADLILLHASGEDRLAYVETMALDGETNLKTKNSPSILKDCSQLEGLTRCNAEFVVESPNRDLYRFEGKVTVDDAAAPLGITELLHRGTTLRNTEEAIGIVVNTGEECKIRMNANHHPRAKKPAIESMINRIIITLAIYMITLSAGLSGGYRLWQQRTESKAWFLAQASVGFHEIIIGYLIQFNNVIPLALFVSLEIVKLVQQWMLNSDLEIYDEASDTPTRCNTNTILENLGQVSYILTDKTGTLTENLLKFRKMTVAGTSWYLPDKQASDGGDLDKLAASSASSLNIGKLIPRPRNSVSSGRSPRSPFLRRVRSYESSNSSIAPVPGEMSTDDLNEFMRQRPGSFLARKARDLILAIALCHTCLPEERDGEVDFQASSADELALARAARELGFSVTKRSPQTMTIEIKDLEDGHKMASYEILDVIEFSSKRKRFSIVLKYPDGRIALLCKGADSVIIPRLRQADLAIRMAKQAGQMATAETEMHQRLESNLPRNSFGGRPSLTVSRSPSHRQRTSFEEKATRSKSLDLIHTMKSNDILLSPTAAVTTRSRSFDIRGRPLSHPSAPTSDARFNFLDDPGLHRDENVFRKCFQQLEGYARDGLRTLIYAQKFIPEQEYLAWKKIYEAANTSFVDRQALVEEAGEIIEKNLELVGATAIEDRLQQGVPQTIDKLRRANIKIWMLTGDKRETAINIAHSASICKPGSSVIILDSTSHVELETQIVRASTETNNDKGKNGHNVIVIDGPTLSIFDEDPDLRIRLFTLLLAVDSVICCRASPAQKAQLVCMIRSQLPNKLTLAIGDGGNDVAMIQESSIGIGISGGGAKEGLQASRVADFSIPQFRFLQRLLLVHGRWNYSRTATFVLATFWKEAFFYIPTAVYQRYNGYTGTSLYEMASLTVFNVLFTALCVVVPAIWDQDLQAETLLAVPELYVYGQRSAGLNMTKYFRWMVAAVSEGVLVWFGAWLGYGAVFGPVVGDAGLFAFGDLAFSVGVVWINIKLFLFETHHKTWIVGFSFVVTMVGWWVWNILLSTIYSHSVSIYAVKFGFTKTFGPDLVWWITLVGTLGLLSVAELAYKGIKRNLTIEGLWTRQSSIGCWIGGILERKKNTREMMSETSRGRNAEEWDLELWQELEQLPAMKDRMRRILREEKGEDINDEDDVLDLRDVMAR